MSRVAFVVEPSSRKPSIKNEGDTTNPLYTPSYIQLVTAALLKRGHEVDIYNNAIEETTINGVRYRPISSDKRANQADLVIVHNGAQDLPFFTFKRAAIWQHNKTSFVKAWKRKELSALWRFRPDVICLSQDAVEKTPNWIPYRKKQLIPHAIQDEYLAAASSSLEGKQMKAYFASRPSRNLDFLIRAWERYVHPNLPQAELIICCPANNKPFPFDTLRLKNANIHYVGSLEQSSLIELGRSSRMLCYPGHINETGCRVALDAIGLGLPIVTCGIGSLKDLVDDKKTGFIEGTEKAYAMRVIEGMTNDELWESMSKAACKHPWRQSYDQNILLWESAFELN